MSESFAFDNEVSRLDPVPDEELVRALDGSADQLADEVFLLFTAFMPEAHSWSATRRAEFVNHAKGRLQAILAIVGLTSETDVCLREDLEAVGANAARQGSSLPHLLIVLRISRDLLLQSAMRLAEDQGGRWDEATSHFAARLLPVVDRLTDGITTGYWESLLDESEEQRHCLSTIVESQGDPIYEADLDGVIRYVNNAFTLFVGQPADRLIGKSLSSVLPVDGKVISMLLSEPRRGTTTVPATIRSADGETRDYAVSTVVRSVGVEILGFGGIIRPATPFSS